MTPEALEVIQDLETRLALPKDFFISLAGGDDWSFIIKLNALFEASATDLLCKRLRAPELENSFAHLDFGNAKFGKVTLLRKLGCLDKQEVRFLKTLYELRNRVAHNVTDVSFRLKDYTASLDANQKNSFLDAVLAGGDEYIQWNCEQRPRRKFIETYPNLAILMTSAEVLASMCQQSEDWGKSVPALTSLNRTALSPLGSAKAAAEQKR
ncbi:hypothetical protein MARI_20830 [Marinobacter sp. JH2]|nr:hypothetical protein [Marinobacter sp. JH2]QBM17959.1 hypothetical protein MARI_20830 [Marinobacter sp. JH2]